LTKRQRLQLEDLAQSVVGLIRLRIRRSEMDEYRLARAENERACSRLKNHTAQLRALAERVPPAYRDAPII
jgi:hypothetical protein